MVPNKRAPQSADYRAHLVQYFDELLSLENELQFISALCRRTTDGDAVDGNDGWILDQIGIKIQRYLDGTRILRHYFFNEALGESLENSDFSKAELARLSHERPLIRSFTASNFSNNKARSPKRNRRPRLRRR